MEGRKRLTVVRLCIIFQNMYFVYILIVGHFIPVIPTSHRLRKNLYLKKPNP